MAAFSNQLHRINVGWMLLAVVVGAVLILTGVVPLQILGTVLIAIAVVSPIALTGTQSMRLPDSARQNTRIKQDRAENSVSTEERPQPARPATEPVQGERPLSDPEEPPLMMESVDPRNDPQYSQHWRRSTTAAQFSDEGSQPQSTPERSLEDVNMVMLTELGRHTREQVAGLVSEFGTQTLLSDEVFETIQRYADLTHFTHSSWANEFELEQLIWRQLVLDDAHELYLISSLLELSPEIILEMQQKLLDAAQNSETLRDPRHQQQVG